MDRIKKTDSAAKTVESWWALLFAEGSLGRWIGPMIGAGAFGYAAKISEWLNEFGPIGWVTAAGVGFALAATGFAQIEAFRLKRLHRTSPNDVEDDSREEKLSQEELTPLIDARLNEFLTTKLRSEFSSHSQMHAQDERLARLEDGLKSVREIVEGGLETHAEQLRRLGEKLNSVVSYIDMINRDVERRLEQVDTGFSAIHNRERHQLMFKELERHYIELERPILADKGLGNGDEWLKSVKHWIRNLDEWLSVVEYYAMGVSKRVKDIPDFVYERPWAFNEDLLTAIQVHRYKQVATWWQNAQEQKRRVDKQLEYAAFHAPSKRPKNGSPPKPAEDQ